MILAVAAAAVFAGTRPSGEPHQVTVTIPEAVSVVAGQEVRIAGRKVGSVGSVSAVDRGRAARLRIDLGERAWPLSSTSRMTLRWGGTISYANRYIDLLPGRSGRPVVDGGIFPAARFTTPVELDSVINTFDADTRRGIRAVLSNAGAALDQAKRPLRRTLVAAPPALHAVDAVLQDLGSNEAALATLVRSTDQVIDAAYRTNPDLTELVTATATTLTATGREASALKAGLTRAPGTLRQVDRTLAAADTTLELAGHVTSRLAPGAAQLQRLARPLSGALDEVTSVAPAAVSTLRDLQRAAPRVNPLLGLLGRRMPQVQSISEQTSKQLECIRPYTPDIVSWFTNWGGFMSGVDGGDRYLRANVEVPLAMPNNADARTPAEAVRASPQLTYAFPRPPGYNAGQPWFLPQCGAGEDALDPSKDPEARNTYKLMPADPAPQTRRKAGR